MVKKESISATATQQAATQDEIAYYHTLLNATQDIIFTLDCEQRHTGVFGRWLEDPQLQETHFLGRTTREILGPEAAKVHEAANLRALAGEYVTYEWSIATTAGLRYYQTSLSPLYAANGALAGIVGIGHDITAQKRTEQALRASEARFQRMANSIQDGITIIEHGKVVYANKRAYEIFGVDAATYYTLTGFEAAAPEERARLRELVAHSRQSGDFPADLTFWIERPDGSRRYIHNRYTPNREGDQIIGRIVVTSDITERYGATEALADRERFLTLLNHITRMALSTSDFDTLLQSLAEHLAQLFRADNCYLTLWDADNRCAIPVAAEGDLRHTYRDLTIQPEDKTLTAAALEAGKPLIIPDVRTTPHLSPHLKANFPDRSLLVLPLIVDGENLGAALIAYNEPHTFSPNDVQQGKQAADQIALALAKAQLVTRLQEHNTQLEARNRELDAFAHTVAHDLKAPLSTVIGYAEVIADAPTTFTTDELSQHLQLIAEHARKMNHIINALLLLASVREQDEIKLVPLEMADIIAEVQTRIADLAAEYNAEIAYPNDWPTALGYAPWIEEVWVNYLSNALKYGGEPPHITLGATPIAPDQVRFWVCDDGTGLTPEEQARLFTPFEQLHQLRISGHGLGLSIVRRIAERLGGSVGVTSEPGHGSTFYFTLPSAPTTR
ncbi:MAG TPA: PAS domain S-box protein [Chloroflexi bacterium]|nr:PAS domain S-box protein [Chloroflexota bacterium]